MFISGQSSYIMTLFLQSCKNACYDIIIFRILFETAFCINAFGMATPRTISIHTKTQKNCSELSVAHHLGHILFEQEICDVLHFTLK